MLACKIDGAMKRNDRLARTGRTGYAGRPGVSLLDELALFRVQKDDPLVPWVLKRTLQFGTVRHGPESALCIRVLERVVISCRHCGNNGCAAGCQFEQSLPCFLRQPVRQREDRVLVRLVHVAKPLLRHAIAEKLVVGSIPKEWRLLLRLGRLGKVLDDRHLPDTFTQFHQLGRTSLRVPFQSSAFRPLIGLVVVRGIAQKKARVGPMNDDPDVSACAD